MFIVDEKQLAPDLLKFSVVAANGRSELIKRDLTLSLDDMLFML